MGVVDTGAAEGFAARRHRFTAPRIAALLITLHAMLLTWSAFSNSVTFDEFSHLPAGVSYWRYGTFDIYNLSPPLLRLWAAAPVMVASPDVPPIGDFAAMLPKDRHWAFAEAFLQLNRDRYHGLFLIGRLAMVPLSCLGGWVVYRWAAQLYGDEAALTACAAYVLCPNLCGHASLVGTDAGTAVFMLLAAWSWWRFCRGIDARSRRWLAITVIAIGAAHLCKFTALLLWPMLVAIALCVGRARLKRVAAGFIVALAGCLVIVNVGYAFQGTATRAQDLNLRSRAMRSVFDRLPHRLPIPLPAPLVLGFDAQKWEFEQGLPSFLFGRSYRGSRWYYYPVALALKLPLATWTMIALGVFARRCRWTADDLAVAASAAVFLVGAIVLAGADLGVRYVLPAVPLLLVFVARFRHRWITPTLLALLALANLSVAPRYLTFFNLLAGGGSRGQFVLNDSNFDWGQGLIDLKRWMTANDVPSVQLGYFGRVDPGVYGIKYHLLTEVGDEPYIAVSSYYLAGLPHRLPSPAGPTGWFQLEGAEQLRRKPRVAIVAGGTIHIFTRASVAEAMEEARLAARRRDDR